MLNRIAIIPSMLLLSTLVSAELKDLTESELSELTGEGVGLVYESYQIEMLAEELNARDDGAAGTLAGGDAGNQFLITGIEDANGNVVTTSIGQFYFAGTGTNYGMDLDGKVVNIGRLNNPISIDLVDGNTLGDGTDGWADKSVLEIAMPKHVAMADGYHCTDPSQGQGTGTCASRSDQAVPGFHGERFDMGYRINREFTDSNKNVNLNFHAVSANMDGSYMRFWGGDADVNGDDIDDSTLMLEAQMNFYASELMFDSCNLDGSVCGDQVGFKDFRMELALGDAKYYQPMTIAVDANGFLNISIQALPEPGDLRTGGGSISADGLLAGSDAATWNWYDDYYTNGRKTNISVGDMTAGPSAESFGSSSIQGLQIQYLEVKSRDIP